MPYEIGFDREKYIQMQSEHIQERRAEVGGKLYLEMGGKLFDDNHASRVLPGFTPDNKIAMLDRIKDEVEIVICFNAGDVVRHHLISRIVAAYDRHDAQNALRYEKRQQAIEAERAAEAGQ